MRKTRIRTFLCLTLILFFSLQSIRSIPFEGHTISAVLFLHCIFFCCVYFFFGKLVNSSNSQQLTFFPVEWINRKKRYESTFNKQHLANEKLLRKCATEDVWKFGGLRRLNVVTIQSINNTSNNVFFLLCLFLVHDNTINTHYNSDGNLNLLLDV